MKKLIAVSGSPGSGKTTTAIKIAQEIYSLEKCTIAYISSDYTVPFLASVFPTDNIEYTHSLGKMFDRTELEKEDVLKAMYNTKGMDNLVFLGYKSGENRYTYPAPTTDKVKTLFEILSDIVDYIIVDCQSGYNDVVSNIAISKADCIIHVINPDVKSLTYFTSLERNSEDLPILKVLNIIDKENFAPLKETEKHYGKIEIAVPFSQIIKTQSLSGSLTEPVKDKKYKAAIEKLTKEVIKDV